MQFASFRSPLEEREYSRTAFYKAACFVLISLGMSLIATKNRRGAGVALLG